MLNAGAPAPLKTKAERVMFSASRSLPIGSAPNIESLASEPATDLAAKIEWLRASNSPKTRLPAGQKSRRALPVVTSATSARRFVFGGSQTRKGSCIGLLLAASERLEADVHVAWLLLLWKTRPRMGS
jgi:hypothetical protein